MGERAMGKQAQGWMKRCLWLALVGLVLITTASGAMAEEWLYAMTKLPPLSEEYVCINFERNEKRAVYSAPGEDAFRAANGKASVSLRDEMTVWGKTEDEKWWLIEYDYGKDQRRTGYIRAIETEKGKSVADQIGVLREPSVCVVTRRKTELTDDFWGASRKKRKMAELPAKQAVTVISDYGLDWVYVETRVNGKPARGIVRHEDICLETEYEDFEMEQTLADKWIFVGGSEILGDAVALLDGGTYIECSREELGMAYEEMEDMGEEWVTNQLVLKLDQKCKEKMNVGRWWLTVDALGRWLWREWVNADGKQVTACNYLSIDWDDPVCINLHVGVDIGLGAMSGGFYIRAEDAEKFRETQNTGDGDWG